MGRPAGQPRCLHRLHASRLRPALARGGPGSDRGELCVLPRGFLHSFVKLSRSPSGRRGARPAAGRGALAFLWGRLSPLSPRVRKTRTRRSAWGAETGQARDRKHGLLGSARCCFVCTSHPRPGLALGRTLHEFCLGRGGAVPGCARALQGAACLQPRVSCGLPSPDTGGEVAWSNPVSAPVPRPGSQAAREHLGVSLATCRPRRVPAGPVLFWEAGGREMRHLPDCGVSQGCWPGRRFGGRDLASDFQTGLGARLLCGSPVGSLCGSGGRYPGRASAHTPGLFCGRFPPVALLRG